MQASDPLGDGASSAQRLTDPSTLARLWSLVQEHLRGRLRREQYETWFPRTALLWVDERCALVAVHNGFTRDWLQEYYQDTLVEAFARVLGGPRSVDFEVDPERAAIPCGPEEDALVCAPAVPAAAALAPPDVDDSAAGLLESSDVRLSSQYRFDNFVVGPCNRFAHAACVGISENAGKLYNPLFIHGSVGLGKTHLLQSLCHSLLERDRRARILYLSCETFVNHFIEALENGDLQTFRHKYRNVDLLVVDDIHILANKERTQEEFFHTFNTLYNAGKQIVLSSDSPPVDIPTLQDRLISRFKWGLVTEIEAPCYETRVAILKRKSRERGHELPDEVAGLLSERMESNIRELEGAVTKVLGFAALSGRSITTTLVRECLPEAFHGRHNLPSVEDILRVVTERFGVKLSDLQSKKRTNAIAFPRQVGMYLARRITRMSLEEIGGYFGGRDHSTVLYGVEKINRMSAEDPSLNRLLNELVLDVQARSRDGA